MCSCIANISTILIFLVVAQVVECLRSNCEVLSLNHCDSKQQQQQQNPCILVLEVVKSLLSHNDISNFRKFSSSKLRYSFKDLTHHYELEEVNNLFMYILELLDNGFVCVKDFNRYECEEMYGVL
jgi:hypothetical protein